VRQGPPPASVSAESPFKVRWGDSETPDSYRSESGATSRVLLLGGAKRCLRGPDASFHIGAVEQAGVVLPGDVVVEDLAG
jgi:hypothetical protein